MPDDSLFHAMGVLAGKYYGKFVIGDFKMREGTQLKPGA